MARTYAEEGNKNAENPCKHWGFRHSVRSVIVRYFLLKAWVRKKLENRLPSGHVGSNPTPSATFGLKLSISGFFLLIFCIWARLFITLGKSFFASGLVLNSVVMILSFMMSVLSMDYLEDCVQDVQMCLYNGF